MEVLVSKTDVSTLEGAKQLIKEAHGLGPLGGVFHLAMVTVSTLSSGFFFIFKVLKLQHSQRV